MYVKVEAIFENVNHNLDDLAQARASMPTKALVAS
jgi:hypothetical protein